MGNSVILFLTILGSLQICSSSSQFDNLDRIEVKRSDRINIACKGVNCGSNSHCVDLGVTEVPCRQNQSRTCKAWAFSCEENVSPPKPGNCPEYDILFRGSCDNMQRCNDDTNCPTNQKCCLHRCGASCLSPE
ncbi:uncharacterized protein LOC141899602 [Tubulanus polymorphus]|uniref:uncharacterized protein LOC141899602 n=1 Tax=Tubulanus polymorphus TaxID=672921 RepID=UPI003DA48089